MVIRTDSSRLALAARICRLLPPLLSARVQLALYPIALARRENAAFAARSSLADVVFEFPRAELDAVSFAIRGFYEWRTIAIANTICGPGDCIIEIGSNIGTETVLLAKIVGPGGRVISFEPLAENAECQERLIERNGLRQIELHRAAVSDRPGRCFFEKPTDSWNSGTGQIIDETDGRGGCIEVEMLTLDGLAAEGRLAPAKLLVMDVEAAELRVLAGGEGYMRAHAPAVLLEVNGERLPEVGLRVADVDDYFRERGYSRWLVKSTGLRPADRNQTTNENWLCLPRGDSAESRALAKRISRRILRALVTPLIRRLNPAVIDCR
ncbi:MAG: hypothetical protein AMXMBFR47_26020 [Planctomycetota bacterium]